MQSDGKRVGDVCQFSPKTALTVRRSASSISSENKQLYNRVHKREAIAPALSGAGARLGLVELLTYYDAGCVHLVELIVAVSTFFFLPLPWLQGVLPGTGGRLGLAEPITQ